MTRRVLRWEVAVDDRPHPIGAGRVVHVDCRQVMPTGIPNGRVEVWTEEKCGDWPETQVPMRKVQVFGTGQRLPETAAEHIGAALDAAGALVWHVYYVREA